MHDAIYAQVYRVDIILALLGAGAYAGVPCTIKPLRAAMQLHHIANGSLALVEPLLDAGADPTATPSKVVPRPLLRCLEYIAHFTLPAGGDAAIEPVLQSIPKKLQGKLPALVKAAKKLRAAEAWWRRRHAIACYYGLPQ